MPIKYSDVLAQIAQFVDKDCTIQQTDARLTGRLFDVQRIDAEFLEEFLSDTFGDGLPEGLDLQSSVPFFVVGVVGDLFSPDDDFEGQPEGLLFLDLANGDGQDCPVWAVDIDGTAIPETYRKLCDRIADLDIEPS
jgi:hypothetical protein